MRSAWGPRPISATTSGWPAAQVKPALAKLVADGELERVEVDGWTAPGYLRAGQIIPRRDRGTALLCPFDPLIFFRPRVERLFDGFRYRIEIYTPASKRQFGYYVWPFLLDGRLVGRVDLKAERARDALHVVGAFTEDGEQPARVAEALAAELKHDGGMAGTVRRDGGGARRSGAAASVDWCGCTSAPSTCNQGRRFAADS